MRRRPVSLVMLATLLAAAAPAGAGHDGSGPVRTISPAELKAELDAGRRPFLVDLRPVEQYRQGHLPGARSIPLRELRRRYLEIPRGRVVLYCDCPRDELEAAYRFVQGAGVEQVQGLDEPYATWAARGYPVVR